MFIFITRFSLYIPNSKAWLMSAGKENDQLIREYKEKLFDLERLKFRLDFMSKITLPILEEASKKHNIVQVLKYSVFLPEDFKNALKVLAEKHKFLVLCEHDEEGNFPKSETEVALEYFKEVLPKDRDEIIGMAVLDDDDCVSLDYFDRARPYLSKEYAGHALSFGLGINGVFDENNHLIKFSESYYPKVNIGLLRLGSYRHQSHKIVMPRLGAHGRADRYLPVLLDSREISYFWSRHAYQDTKLGKSYEGIISNILKREDIPLNIIEEKFGKALAELLVK